MRSSGNGRRHSSSFYGNLILDKLITKTIQDNFLSKHQKPTRDDISDIRFSIQNPSQTIMLT
jgi:hypothetical protein